VLQSNVAELILVWNALPERHQEDQALQGCRAARLIQTGLEALGETLPPDVMPPVLRAALVTGKEPTGPLGTEHRLRWGCWGRHAKEAEQLLDLAQAWQVSIILASSTREAARRKLLVRTLDYTATHDGMVLPVYELWRAGDEVRESSEEEQQAASLYDAASEAYLVGDIEPAKRALIQYRSFYPEDIPAILQLQRLVSAETAR